MNNKLAQIIALITYGNEYLSSFPYDGLDLFSLHSTFQTVSEVSFYKKKTLQDTSKKTRVVAKDTRTWFSFLKSQGVQYLKLDLLNIQNYLPLHIPSVFTSGGAWVIQTDKKTCWQSKWYLKKHRDPECRIWAVGYWECDNLPVLMDFPDLDTAYQDLEDSLVEAQSFSKKYRFDWEKWFAEALVLLKSPSAISPFYADLLPASYENIKGHQLLAGALKGWVFGGLGSWNDMYIRESSLEREYQLVSNNLYRAVIQSVGAVANSTSIHQLAEIT